MTLLYGKWIPVLVICIILFIYLLYRIEKNYFKWIKLYWFYERSKSSVISTIFFVISITCFAVALLDVRGPEIRLNMELPDQRTIILIDASASMLVEDVRPNRFRRGIFLARHFVRNAVGHQVSVLIFSDLTKRVVSFTNDIDLLDARITGLEKMDITTGGSNISAAIHEAIRYFHEGKGSGPLIGNLVLISDGEETATPIAKDLPPGINLAVIGIGTTQGGYIPMRSQDGTFRGYRRFDGENVVSKLNEDWFKSLAASHQSYKYWIAQSYTVPTEEILDFFANIYDRRMSEGEVRYRPVWGTPLIGMGLFFLALSSLMSLKKTYIKEMLMVVLIGFMGTTYSRPSWSAETSEVEMSQETLDLFEKMKIGKLQGPRRLMLAQSLYKDGFNLEALQLYEEVFSVSDKKKYRESWKNYAFLLLQEKYYKQAGSELEKLFASNSDSNELLQMRTNVILILSQEGQEGGEGEGEENQESDDQEGEEGDSSGDNENEKSDEGQSSDQSGQEENDQESEDVNEQESEKKSEPQNWDAKVQEMKQQLRTKDQIPAVLKQIMDADREIQQDQLDTRTNDPSAGTVKDW